MTTTDCGTAFPHELAAALDAGTLDAYLELRDQAEIARDIKALAGYKTPIALGLRDYFAAAALTGWAAGRNAQSTDSTPEVVAVGCYRYADAMLRERNRGADPDTDAK